MKAIAELAKDALELPPVQRLTLARICWIWPMKVRDFSPEVEAAWETEICRRMEEVKAGRARSAVLTRCLPDWTGDFPHED